MPKINFTFNNQSIPPNPIIDPKFPTIYNIAQTNLTIAEKQLLSKGIKFCPTENPPPTEEYVLAINDLHRKILIKGYFLDQQSDANPINGQDDTHTPENKFTKDNTPKSKWIPTQKEASKIPISIRVLAEETSDTHF